MQEVSAEGEEEEEGWEVVGEDDGDEHHSIEEDWTWLELGD